MAVVNGKGVFGYTAGVQNTARHSRGHALHDSI